jgi:hypothetical protein
VTADSGEGDRRAIPPTAVAGFIVAVVAALLALVPTETYAATFAHPQRMARLGGAIPEATVRGALWLRLALLAAAIGAPLLTLAIERVLRSTASEGGARPVVARAAAPSRPEFLALATIVAIGLLLRLALASESLWYDEISAFVSFALEGPGVAFGSYAVPTNHVPMTLAMWAVAAATGSVSELALRAPAMLAGLAAIPVAWALARETLPASIATRGASIATRGASIATRGATSAALIVAIAPIPAIESAEARGYAFVMLASLVAALALARLVRTRSPGDALLLAAACAFGAWSHPVAVVLPCAIGLVALAGVARRLGDRARAAATLAAAALSFVLAAPLLAPLASDALAHRGDYLLHAEGQPGILSREGAESLLGLSLSWSLGLPTAPWAPLATFLPAFTLPPVVLVALVAAGGLRIARGGELAAARAVSLPFLLAFAIALAAAHVLGTWMYARFFLFALPASVLALAVAIAAPRARAARVALVLALVGQCAVALPVYWRKQPIRDAVEAVAAARRPDDVVLTIGLPDNAAGFYAALGGFEAVPTGFLGAGFERAFDAAPRAPRFVVVLYPDRLDAAVLAALDARCDRTHRFEGWADWGQGAVEVWRSRN